MFQPTSPVLQNSSFSQLDYFATASPSHRQAQTPIFTLSLTTSPTASLSTPNLLLSTPERGRSRSPSPCPTDLDSALGSPQVLSSPKLGLGVKKDSSARRSVQYREKSAVNWARPLRVVEEDPIVSMRIFGASLQRSRRLNRSSAPSPCSSDDEPLTPSPVTPSSTASDDNVQVSLRGWSVFSSAKGLGVSGVAEWDTPVTPLRELSLEPLPDFAFEPLNIPSSISLSSITTKKSTTSTTSKQKNNNLPRSISKPILIQAPPILDATASTPISNSRILATSQSLNSFSSPSNLAELRNLRQAAVVLENEAKRPIRPSPSCPSGQIKDVVAGQRERKIKRKAVPSIAESDIVDYYSTSSCSSLTASTTPSSSSSSGSSSPEYPEDEDGKIRRRNSSIDQILVPRQLPGMDMGNSIFQRHRQLYQNHLATSSLIEISPSSLSTTVNGERKEEGPTSTSKVKTKRKMNITIPPRITSLSNCDDGSGGLEESRNSSISSASSLLSSSEEQPMTPSLTASQTEYFLKSVENAFKKLEFERAEINQTQTQDQPKISSDSSSSGGNTTVGKHKRGFSRFLGKKGPSNAIVKEE
ncbi:hypothetical protein I203_104819 [Kwoniella mangroviensis CBS 8507]|uniref:uncharacterized protein n=1 Tax=Kwoniella mangroviensis CBS 8507 TaxID=1296122 RepID=UPI00080CCE63|nr:uncharacterized protein I203_00239 [Kwoniella mangroviensis CBS 8507]OCF70108.1 hypothetical protein I203_00239 [Kwoniella mangroviensis CBS 8507]